MRIPFAAPQLPELDALAAEQRARVLSRYARSADARRYILVVRIAFILAAVLVLIAATVRGALRVICGLGAASVLVGAVAYYRAAATRAIRTILRTADSVLEDDGSTSGPAGR